MQMPPGDSHLDKLIQQQLKNGQGAAQIPASQVWACRRCGAPIWFCAAAPAEPTPPHACAALEGAKAKQELREFRAACGFVPDEP